MGRKLLRLCKSGELDVGMATRVDSSVHTALLPRVLVGKNGCFAMQIYVPVCVCIYANLLHCKCATAGGKLGGVRGVQTCTWKCTWKWAHTQQTQPGGQEQLGAAQCTWQHAQKCNSTPGTCTGKCKHAWDTHVQTHVQICK